MAYDLSIFTPRDTKPDFAGNFRQGLAAGKELKTGMENQAINEAMKANTVQGPDGKTSLNRSGMLSAIQKINPQRAMEMERDLQKQDYEKMQLQANMAKDLAWSVSDQQSWTAAKQKGLELGLPGVDKLPDQYDPMIDKQLKYRTLTAAEQLAEKRHQDDLYARSMDRAESRAERRALRQDARDERLDRQVDADMTKLSKDIQGAQGAIGSLDEVESLLGGRLEDFKAGGGKITKDGKSVDLPGVNIPILGRTSFYSEDARNLKGAAARVFNAELKDRSGGSVTDQELSRLRQEFNDGKFNTEAELVGALQRYKRQVGVVLKNREAAFKPEVVERYTEQGGRTSRTISPRERPGAPTNILDTASLDKMSDEELSKLYMQMGGK